MVQCGKCGITLDGASHEVDGKRQPCASCGASVRRFNVEITASIKLHDSLKFKHKDAGRNMLAEGFSGDDLHYSSGKWMQKERLVDHKHNIYRERILNPETGDVVHFCEEPLSEHRGHGSDKAKRAKPMQ